jgi:hypothetical protein
LFEKSHFIAAKENKLVHVRFFCDPLEDKIVIPVHVGLNISGANRTHLALAFICVVIVTGQSFAPQLFFPTYYVYYSD